MHKISALNRQPLRTFHSSSRRLVVQQKSLPSTASSAKRRDDSQRREEYKKTVVKTRETIHVKRNELGVQLLSRKLHRQLFRDVTFPAPEQTYVRIAREHLEMHGLDPAQGSVLPDIGFTLPPLQGANLDEHFHRIGSAAAQPWLGLAQSLASTDLPPKPEHWHIQSGWTKYHREDDSGCSEAVPSPMHDGAPEDMLVFDVETMPPYHPYPIMATAASANGWYSWISPWLLGETEDPAQLIPLGEPSQARVVVGHNVSYDRARVAEEYALGGTRTRFVDTMALHVAVKGISSHQRPAWNKHRKTKQAAREQAAEAAAAVRELVRETEAAEVATGADEPARREQLRAMRQELEEGLPQLQAGGADADAAAAELSSKRWEDLTSANSLADVAKLHCGIEVEKEIRNDFMTRSRAEIAEGVQEYLGYCGTDVAVTHAVFAKVLPAFMAACPSPVSFAGVLTMGSSFLTVNQEWERYIENAERTYTELNEKVKRRLVELAEQARTMMAGEEWKGDPWLEQLDWTAKVAGKSRGVLPQEPVLVDEPEVLTEDVLPEVPSHATDLATRSVPRWYRDLLVQGPCHKSTINRILPVLLQMSFDNHPLLYSTADKWHYLVSDQCTRLPTASSAKVLTLLSATHGIPNLASGRMTCRDSDLALVVSNGDLSPAVGKRIVQLADEIISSVDPAAVPDDPWLSQLDWKVVAAKSADSSRASLPASKSNPVKVKKVKPAKPPPVHWPKWYWELAKPKKDMPPGTVDVTVRNSISPILLRLSWLSWPLFRSREYGWTFRVPSASKFITRAKPLEFFDPADTTLEAMRTDTQTGYIFYKLPHKDGEDANVGSPLSKTFMKFAQDGTLTSPGDEAKDALDMNAQCSYWISARDRVLNQMVVWQDAQRALGFQAPPHGQTLTVQGREKKWGVIVPQVITMGTVTRRAIERTWLTASNAKKNRVGSELKAMVRAPEGYAIVGADVDSEELWISSLMGDAQFGLHGATAIGWMTLEGTKAAGTDLHSKTASILGISRDQAKVFNYSRIYGAGMRHAVLLLLQANAGMLPEQAQKLAEELYSQTKGKNTHRADLFGRKFWYGGTESYVFNKLEEIATSDRPQTPALGCGITHALSKEYLAPGFGTDYMTSRINWVVQSSGVDYLHMLIVSMDYLSRKYDINARYLISVHDEVRYLVAEQDRYRAALALQIANLWTRSMFAFKLGMDDLPQGVAFFSAVDVDHILRKEVDMPCVTPSQPEPLAPGESLDIAAVLERTNGGSLWADGRALATESGPLEGSLEGYIVPDCLSHRAHNAGFLRAQATTDIGEIKHLAHRAAGKTKSTPGGNKAGSRKRSPRKLAVIGGGVDWERTVDAFIEAEASREG